MNTIDSNKSNISFGIAFKKYRAKSGNMTTELLNIHEEVNMYKKINQKLKQDKFIKTKLGIKSKDMTLIKDHYVPGSTAMRYKDATGDYFFDDNRIELGGVQAAFKELCTNFEKIFKR